MNFYVKECKARPSQASKYILLLVKKVKYVLIKENRGLPFLNFQSLFRIGKKRKKSEFEKYSIF